MPANLVIKGKAYDLSHLATVISSGIAHLRAGSEKKLRIDVHYSCHCYSRLPKSNEVIPLDQLIPDGSEIKPRNRIFDETRFELSHQLPSIISRMLSPEGVVHYTDRDNVVRYELVESIIPLQPAIKYFVFIKLTKIAQEGQQKFIKLVVESAYPESDMFESPNYSKPVNVGVLLGQLWENRTPQK